MRFLTEQQASERYPSVATPTCLSVSHARYQESRSTSIYIQKLPIHASVPLARAAVSWVYATDPASILLWNREYDIWDSSEDLVLLARLAEPLGGGNIGTHPVLEAGGGERDQLIGFVFLALVFGWGWVLTDGEAGRAVTHNHEGEFWWECDDPEAMALAKQWLAPSDVKG